MMFLKNKKLKILVTGTNSGLGKYINNILPNSIFLNRKNRKTIIKSREEYDIIIHCAFNTKNAGRKDVKDVFSYIDDNILLTNELTSIRHKKFVYISSIAVYDELISPYMQTKIYAESIVQNKSNNPLIVRCSSLLGRHMRKNTLTKIITEEKPKITLAKNSTYNLINHEDVLNFISDSCKKKVSGIFDFVASDYLVLEEICNYLNAKVEYGNYIFATNRTSNSNLINTFPKYNKSSWESLKYLIEEIK
jgi:dTDP-4-dehydrorhamnose reductase